MRNKDFGKLVLCAIDLGRNWHTIVEQALRHARPAGAGLHLVYALEPPGTALSRLFDSDEARAEQKRHCRTLERETLNQAREAFGDEVPITVAVRPGLAAALVLKEAERLGAGLIVVGAGEWDGWNRLFVGSTADRLVRHAHVPVLIASPHPPKPIKRILVPTDLDRADEGAVRVASRIATREKARVSVLHAYGLPSMQHRYMGNLADLRREVKREARESFAEYVDGIVLAEDARPLHRLLIANTDEERPSDAIIETCERLHIDLIVMALGGISMLQSVVIGAVAERLIRDLPCDLLALPTRWARKR